jgi:phage gp45-like
MGLIATLVKLTSAKLDTKGNAPGKSAVATAEGFSGQTMTPEVYQAPGVLAVPPDGVRGVYIPVGASDRYGVVIALQNYQITLDLQPGETAIYSTTADGKTVKAKIVLDDAGDIALNGDTKRLVTWQELQTVLTSLQASLIGHVHPSNGAVSPGLAALSLDISGAKTTTIKTGG